MPNWKKVITSGSDAAFRSVIATAGFTGSFSGSVSTANAVTIVNQASNLSYPVTFASSGNSPREGALYTAGPTVNVLLVNPSFASRSISVSGSATISNSLTVTGSVRTLAGFTGSLQGTSSYVTGAIFIGSNPALSASYALTASYAINGGGTPTPTFPYTGDAQIDGSLSVTGSLSVSGASGHTGSIYTTNTKITNVNNVDDWQYVLDNLTFDYRGDIVQFNTGNINANQGELCAINGTKWDPVTGTDSPLMEGLTGVYVNDQTGEILLDGYLLCTFNGAVGFELTGGNVTRIGARLYSTSDPTILSNDVNTAGGVYTKYIGYVAYIDTTDNNRCIVRFKPDTNFYMIEEL